MPRSCHDAHAEMAHTELPLPLKACRSRLYGQPGGACPGRLLGHGMEHGPCCLRCIRIRSMQ